MGRTPKSWTKAEREMIQTRTASLRAIGLSRERARQQAEAEVRHGLPMVDVIVVDDEGNVEPRRSRQSILDW